MNNPARTIIEAVQSRTMIDTHKGCLLITEDELESVETLLTQIGLIIDDEYIYKSPEVKLAAIKSFLKDF